MINLKSVIRRRSYNVPGPNYVWHIDGNHKLICWRIIIHGGIDGYSGVIVFLRPSTNNFAATVLSCFENGVSEYGLPNRICSDLGGENVEVWRYMVRAHNDNSSCIIVGSSTHNKRLERFWRDVHRCVLRPFGDHFRHLEEAELLDPLNEVDIFCLHATYLPRINRCISSFQESWNNHRLSMEGNATPFQLFLAGSIGMNEIPHMPASCMNAVPTPGAHIVVPRSQFIPCMLLCQELETRFDPLLSTNYFDDGLYVSIVMFVAEHLQVCRLCSE